MSNSRPSQSMARLVLLSLAAVLSTGPLAGQSQRGSLVGTVADSSDAVVPKAKVEVTHEATGGKFQAETGNDGFYTVPYLPYGRFTVAVNAPGFKTYTLTGVEVATATQTTLNVALSLESQTQEVRVEAVAALLEAHTSAVGTNVEQRLKDELPVTNRRNPLTYLNLVPGYQPSTQTTFGGGRYGSNNILLDGQTPDLSVTSQGDFGNASLPSVEAIGEFKALLNSVPAEYGRTGGPTISFATRSGSNDLHGSAYEYYDNQVFNARPWQAGQRAEGHQHYFGGAAGGPVRIPKLYNGRNKSFFFADYSDIRQSSAGASTNITTLPTANMRRGDFSASDVLPVYDPLTLATDAQGNQRRQPFPGNQIPATRLSTVSRFFLDKLPTANRPGSLSNFVGSLPPQAQTQWLLFVKGDHYVSERDRLSGSYQAG
ncbi:MAG: carboxypeptidase-like regulatory domain-containing protein, partial [Chloroflexia bacterium]